MDVSVRQAEEADEDCLRALRSAAEVEVSAQRAGPMHLDVEHGLPVALDGERLVALAEIDGVTIGYLDGRLRSISGGRSLCDVASIFVEPAAREVGAGECLVDFALEWAASRGAIGIDVHALPGAREVKNFFESSGFVARLIVMHRPLSGR